MFKPITNIVKELNFDKVLDILALNEVSGKREVAYRFSYAGSGVSGYSFGLSQFDISNNSTARQFLLDNGFTRVELQRLLNMDPNIYDLNQKLKTISKQIDLFDKEHIIKSCQYIATLPNIPPMSTKTFIHLVDYHNQFNLSKNGKMHNFLKANPNYLLSCELLDWKLKNTKWGRENPQDVWRRYKNIEKYFDLNIYDEE